jgi:hypothetical protein
MASRKYMIDYPAEWDNGFDMTPRYSTTKQYEAYDDHLELHGDIDGYGVFVEVLTPVDILGYDEVISQVKGLLSGTIESEIMNGYTLLTVSDDVKAYIYKYGGATIPIISLIDSKSGQSEKDKLSNIILSMMKSIITKDEKDY